MEFEICAKAAQCGGRIEFAEDGRGVAGVAAGEIINIINILSPSAANGIKPFAIELG